VCLSGECMHMRGVSFSRWAHCYDDIINLFGLISVAFTLVHIYMTCCCWQQCLFFPSSHGVGAHVRVLGDGAGRCG